MKTFKITDRQKKKRKGNIILLEKESHITMPIQSIDTVVSTKIKKQKKKDQNKI